MRLSHHGLGDEPPLSVLSLHLLRDEVPLGFLRA